MSFVHNLRDRIHFLVLGNSFHCNFDNLRSLLSCPQPHPDNHNFEKAVTIDETMSKILNPDEIFVYSKFLLPSSNFLWIWVFPVSLLHQILHLLRPSYKYRNSCHAKDEKLFNELGNEQPRLVASGGTPNP
eukprot:TRINITY_DN14927_c0_g1_i1.p1 TRINITY_DN14927_c0_g1~~TRINITY_DN14927_c0_g1_i1.p1  ORF type:complete len:147 (-),score=24.25 TRINITY_DN14927_c0_g1_i1:338-730(-)